MLRVFNDISQVRVQNPVVTIGIFDGVHLGHVEILRRIRKLAPAYKGESVVITLWPHPRFVLQPDNTELKLLTSLDEKIRLIENQGIDNLVILRFTTKLANIPYDQFVRDYLNTTGWDKNSPPPELPADIVAKTSAKYLEIYRLLTGKNDLA